jgi:hypothetical protein
LLSLLFSGLDSAIQKRLKKYGLLLGGYVSQFNNQLRGKYAHQRPMDSAILCQYAPTRL